MRVALADAHLDGAILDLAGSEPVNINVFPNLSLLGNHIQVFQPISVDETDTVWYGTKIEDADGTIGEEVLRDINEAGLTFRDLRTSQSSLEDIFVNLVASGELEAAE